MNRFDKIDQWCDQAVLWSLCVLIFSLPASIALVESFSGFTIFFYLIKIITRGVRRVEEGRARAAGQGLLLFLQGLRPQGGMLGTPLRVSILVVFISVLLSHYLSLSLIAFVAKFLQGVFLYLSFSECVKSPKEYKKFVTAFLISGAIVCLSGIFQLFTHVDFLRGNSIGGESRITSSFRHANDFGAYLIVLVLLTIALSRFSLTSRSFLKPANVAFTALALLTTICLGLTFSRGGWIGMMVAVMLYGILTKSIRGVILFIVIFLGIFLPLMVHWRNVSFTSDDIRADHRLVEKIVQKEDNAQPIKGEDSIMRGAQESVNKLTASTYIFVTNLGGMGRTSFWMEAINIIRTAPAFGVGLNAYSKVAPDYRINWGGYPHNCYLQMAAEVGLIGLGAFLFMIYVLFRETIRALRVMQDKYLKAAVIGGLAGLSGFLVQSFFDTTLYSVQLGNFLWIMLGFIVAGVQTAKAIAVIDKK